MNMNNQSEAFSSQLAEIELLTTLPFEECDRGELIRLARMLGRELLAYRDLLCDTAAAARILGRKRSWIYDAVSRPSTDFQQSVAAIAAHEGASVVFRVSDLMQLRRRLFGTSLESASKPELMEWLASISAEQCEATCHCPQRSL